MEILVGQLMEGESRRCVVSVVGMGGLGKTTLIRKVYNNNRVKTHFDSCEWICISQDYSVRDLLTKIINRYMVISEADFKNMDLFQLRHKISLYLQRKRYLMVLDDIWTMEAWDALKDAFPDMNNGSRVMLTARNKDVALHAQSLLHELRFLEKDESWDLFCKKAFPGQNKICPPDHLEKLGKVIVEKCHGLPLAIVLIGGLLARKEAREWENVQKSLSWQFIQGEVKIISHVLSLSYEDLPYYLKPCFLYLGNFPEDHEFRAKELIQMWAAEGFLQQRGEETLEEVGEDCLKELIQRSMVQVARRSSSGDIKSCRIHDLLRDLSISEAKESMFLQVISGNANAPPASRARRLAIHNKNSSEYISLSCSTPYLRSVLMYTQGDAFFLREKEKKFLFSGFKFLRVLHMHGEIIDKLPREIGELIHLRYLGCSRTSVRSLPSSIGNLSNLQTLFVASSYYIKVPSTIGKMKQLRHFQVKGSNEVYGASYGEIEGCPSFDRIKSLQTLSLVISGKWMVVGCLGKLTNLSKLGIYVYKETDAEVLYESIVNLDCLHSLRLDGKLSKLPDSSFFPTNLTNLTLKYPRLEEDPMATLERLKNLRILRLSYNSYIGKEMACSAQGFPRLESLNLCHLQNLEEWRVENVCMPSLLHLRINLCQQLMKLPEGLQHMTTLNKLELWSMPNEFEARLEEDRGEDWDKIRHVPSIDISDGIY